MAMSPFSWYVVLFMLITMASGCTRYDVKKPDTASNRDGFQRLLGQPPSADVKGIYYYADEFGADSIYQLRFEASPATVDSLATSLGLSEARDAPSQDVARGDLSWWPAARIEGLRPVWKTNPSEDHYWMLWYDEARQEAFFLEFTL